MSLLRALRHAGLLRPLDEALANTLRRLDPATPDEVLAAAALASLAVASGHAGFAPHAPRELVDADIAWPDPAAWMRQLAASRFVATPQAPLEEAAPAPLVFEPTAPGQGLLYLRRYREYERRLAVQLQRIAAQSLAGHPRAGADPTMSTPSDTSMDPRLRGGDGSEASPVAPTPSSPTPRHPRASEDQGDQIASPEESDPRHPRASGDPWTSSPNPETPTHLAPLFNQLFPPTTADPHQARAAALALRRTLLLVTGGPGTGKTTTIARLLVLRIAQALHARGVAPRIALAAPTGRAAERMADSLRRATAQMAAAGVDPALLAALPTDASTLHRLLGTVPDVPRFRHHADNPLPFDIVVVDEASMVDLPLMCKLAEAVSAGDPHAPTQLILLGDPDQLPSVEAGDVLAAILAATGPGDALHKDDTHAPHELDPNAPHGPVPSARHPRASGDPWTSSPTPTPPTSNPLHNTRIHLQRPWRQSDTLHLAPLADAVRNGHTPTALTLLRGGALANVQFHEAVDDPLQAHPALLAHWRTLATHADPAHALRESNRLRLLTALRDGPQGARGLNARIEAALSGRRIGTPPAWFPGRLLLVTRNSYRHNLFNGDVGICLPDHAGTALAWFPGTGNDTVRAFHPAALPEHASAFAMTVHKAQGSEFDEVWLQLPRTDSRVLSRELLYTGITRARSVLHVAGGADVIAAALGRHAARVSGLGWRLERVVKLNPFLTAET